eukprot:TRINITY_DN11542_c1_g1_i1.p1 TRINITY_DN11542_c1_g1~~TRINITY_DN11542_c1_g1_i1.p1  ORF type:complete len:196 (-),score=7.70 TRINITY_DN11542_c1_g1_i1:548-1135(-)
MQLRSREKFVIFTSLLIARCSLISFLFPAVPTLIMHHPPMSEEPRSLFQSDLFTFMPCLGIGILTVSTIFSAIRARHDLPTLSFVISIYVFLMLLFWCLHLHDRSPHDTKRKERLKVPIWLFATILNVLFAYRVSTILPLSLDFLVWAMAASTSLCGFYFFFIYRDDSKTVSASTKIETGEKICKVSEPFVAEKV